MPTAKTWKLPPPTDNAEFEDICVDLIEAVEQPLQRVNRYGRNGQKQHGVDFFFPIDAGVDAYQCKRVEEITFKMVEEELEQTSSFPHPIQAYTILTTAPTDGRLQDAIATLSRDREKAGLFPVAVVFWPRIRGWFAQYDGIRKAHYPNIEPDLETLAAARAERLEREFPGASLEVHISGSRTGVTVHPGPDGIPFSGTLEKEAFARFEDAMKKGEAVEFRGAEMTLNVPDVLRLRAPTSRDQVKIRIEPALNNRVAEVRLEVQPASQHRTLDDFVRRVRRAPIGIPARLTTDMVGTQRMRISVEPRDLPLMFRLERDRVADTWVDHVGVDKHYTGHPVEHVLEVEKLFSVMDQGAYTGVFHGRDVLVGFETHESGLAVPWLISGLELLSELAVLADWDLVFPETLHRAELEVAASLLVLFRDGKRVLGRGGTVDVIVSTPSQLSGVRGLINNGVPPFTAVVDQEPGVVTLLGQDHPMPATRLRLPHVDFTDECRRAVADAQPDDPIKIQVQIGDDAEVVEELADKPALDERDEP